MVNEENYIKIICLMTTPLHTEIIDEVHRGNMKEATDYILTHNLSNCMWVIKPIR